MRDRGSRLCTINIKHKLPHLGFRVWQTAPRPMMPYLHASNYHEPKFDCMAGPSLCLHAHAVTGSSPPALCDNSCCSLCSCLRTCMVCVQPSADCRTAIQQTVSTLRLLLLPAFHVSVSVPSKRGGNTAFPVGNITPIILAGIPYYCTVSVCVRASHAYPTPSLFIARAQS